MLAQQHHHTRILQKPCVNTVCIIPDYRRRASTNSSDIAVITEPESMRNFYFSSRGRTGNRKTPRDELRQRLEMRFGVHPIDVRIAKPAKLQE